MSLTRSLLAATLLLPSALSASTEPPREYRLRLFQTHTRQRIDVVYRRGDSYLPDAMAKLDFFLRDLRTGAVQRYDPKLFDLLSDLMAKAGDPGGEIDVVCGYRTRWSNEYLRRRHRAVAKHSLHMEAKAVDIRVPAVKTARLRDLALALGRGGVGYYRSSDFLHVDVGRVRRW